MCEIPREILALSLPIATSPRSHMFILCIFFYLADIKSHVGHHGNWFFACTDSVPGFTNTGVSARTLRIATSMTGQNPKTASVILGISGLENSVPFKQKLWP